VDLVKNSRFTLVCLLLFNLVYIAQVGAISRGEIAPDFKVTSANGQTFQLSEFKDKKPVYLIFWNTWCPFCIRKMPHYQEIYTFYGDSIEVLAINTSRKDSYSNMLKFIDRHQLDIPMTFDFGAKVSNLYDVINTPTVFIIDVKGVVRYRNNVPDDIGPLLAKWQVVSEGVSSSY